MLITNLDNLTLREKCSNMEFVLVRIFLYLYWILENTNQKKLHIWTLFTQCYLNLLPYTLQYPVKTTILILENRNPIWRSRPEVFCKKLLLNFFAKLTRKHLSRSSIILISLHVVSLQLYQKEMARLSFSCDFWELFHNIFFAKHIQVVTSSQRICDLNWTCVRISNMWTMRRVISIKVW